MRFVLRYLGFENWEIIDQVTGQIVAPGPYKLDETGDVIEELENQPHDINAGMQTDI